MDTYTLTISADQSSSDLLSDALLYSCRTLTDEIVLRLQDHLKLIDHILPPRARYFRGGAQPWISEEDLVVKHCGVTISTFEISLEKLSYSLLHTCASRGLRSCEEEASLRIKDSLHLFRWVGDSGERQWKFAKESMEINPFFSEAMS